MNPTFTLGVILATLLGAAFHVVVGGDVRRLAAMLLASWFGFALGHFIGVALGINLFNIGVLRVFPAVISALICVSLVFALTLRGRRRVR